MKGGRTQDASSLNRGLFLCVRAPHRGKSSEILNAQLPGLFNEMHRAMRRDATRRGRAVRDARIRATGMKDGRAHKGGKKRREDARRDSRYIPSLLPRVSIQRAFYQRAESFRARRAQRERNAQRKVVLSISLLLLLALSPAESRHCPRVLIHQRGY